jgi:predicted RNase H-like HicB family nuclease
MQRTRAPVAFGDQTGYRVEHERDTALDDRLRGWRRRLDLASIPEVPGAHSQGHSRDEARENVIDALRGILELRFGEHALTEPASDSEPLQLTIAA